MDKSRSLKIASVVLFIHGFIELTAILIFFAPAEFLPSDFQEKTVFWMLLSVTYGLCRWVVGYAVWSMKKWGIVFGMVLSMVTMILAPSIYPFGVMDLPLAIVVLAALLHAWFGGERL